jgi:PilZ domain
MADVINDHATAPTLGASATILSLGNEEPYAATITSWVGTEAGLVISARVKVAANVARELAGHRVLVAVRERPTGYTVFSGIARPGLRSILEISGIATLLRELRRAEPRVPADGRVRISSGRHKVAGLQAVDLSRSGVRVRLMTSTDLHLGEHVNVEVDLGYGAPVAAQGEVTRLDGTAGQAVVRFDDLSAEDGTLIDRYVLLQLPREPAPAY